MAFSFNPGQAQQAPPPGSVSEAPPLVVPTLQAPTTEAPVEKISPFAYKNRNKSKFGVYFQGVIFLIFGIIFLSSVGLFLYQRVLLSQVESKKQALEAVEKGFPKLDLDKMRKLSARIKIINKILSERASVNTAFKLLESTALDNSITYTTFALTRSKKYKGFDLSFAGQTTNYPALYQQIEILNDKSLSQYFSKISITGTGPLDNKGVGSFRADTVVALEGIDPDTFTIDAVGSTNNKTATTTPTKTSTSSQQSATTTQPVQEVIPNLQ